MNQFIIFTAFILLVTPCRMEESKMTRRRMIEYINRNQTTWIAGENFPEDMTIEDMKRLTGAAGVHRNPEELPIKRYKVVKSQIPDYFDARVTWPECSDVVNTIRNQGGCGSCWAFGSVEAISDRVCIASGGRIKVQFSPEELLQCCSDCVSNSSNTCAGGYTGNAWDYYVKRGLVSGGDYNSNEGCKPYSEAAFSKGEGPTSCQQSCQSNYKTSYNDDKTRGSTMYLLESKAEQIQMEIMAHGPVTAMFAVYEDFYSYKYEIYQHVTGNYVSNHAVKIFGWGREDVPFWWAANSWGNEWGGIGGFFKILRGENHCGIEDFVIAGLASV